MAEKKIAHATPELLAINTAPDNCIVGNQIIPFDITCMLSTAINPSCNVNALSTPVVLLNTQLATVAGDAGSGVKSGTSCGKVEILDASSTVYANGQQVPFHDSLCTMNNGNTVGKLCTAKTGDANAEGDAEGTGSDTGPDGVSGKGGDGGSEFSAEEQRELTKKMQDAEDAGDTVELERLRGEMRDNILKSSMQGYPPTAEQRQLAEDGNYVDYWKSVYDQSDGKLGRTELIGWGEADYVGGAKEWEKSAADYTWNRMEGALSEMGEGAPTMDQLGKDFSRAHLSARDNDTLNTPYLLNPEQIAAYHHRVLDKYGMDHDLFGGTRLFGTETEAITYSKLWAPYADVDRDLPATLFPEWVAGTGHSEVYYGDESRFAKDFSGSWQAEKFEKDFYDKYQGNIPANGNMFNYDSKFGPKEFVVDGISRNKASHLTGSYEDGMATVVGDTVHFRVVNTMGRNSFFGGAWINHGIENREANSDGTRSSTSNIDMTIQWSRKISDLNHSEWYVPKLFQ